MVEKIKQNDKVYFWEREVSSSLPARDFPASLRELRPTSQGRLRMTKAQVVPNVLDRIKSSLFRRESVVKSRLRENSSSTERFSKVFRRAKRRLTTLIDPSKLCTNFRASSAFFDGFYRLIHHLPVCKKGLKQAGKRARRYRVLKEAPIIWVVSNPASKLATA